MIEMLTIQETFPQYLAQKRKLSDNSRKAYTFMLQLFARSVGDKLVKELTHQDLANFISKMEKDQRSPASIGLAVSAVLGFFRWAAFQRIWDGNVDDVEYVAEDNKPSLIPTVPQYDHEVIIGLVEWAASYAQYKKLIDKRDSFLILTLSSTGARVGKEACALKRGQVDWDNGSAMVIGKGRKLGELLFSDLALASGKSYLQARAEMDGKSGLPLASLPLFARHVGKSTKPLGYAGAYKALRRRALSLFDPEKVKNFHPHLFRHDFVTRILEETGNIKLAQELARHSNILITQRYAHPTDEDRRRTHQEIFNRTRVPR
jgi:site-specific recombinase XerD